MLIPSLRHKRHWIFDMDGTVTVAQHDFDGIRAELGLPPTLPILESIANLPPAEASAINQRLDDIELSIAEQSQAATGAKALLQHLQNTQRNVGIVTRNNAINIEVTLNAAGLADFFDAEYCISRDCTAPKPAPDGLLQLMQQWQADPAECVMVGDSIHDIRAGINAGISTIYIDPAGDFPHASEADHCIHQLDELFGS